jgi:hypothetical protein
MTLLSPLNSSWCPGSYPQYVNEIVECDAETQMVFNRFICSAQPQAETEQYITTASAFPPGLFLSQTNKILPDNSSRALVHTHGKSQSTFYRPRHRPTSTCLDFSDCRNKLNVFFGTSLLPWVWRVERVRDCAWPWAKMLVLSDHPFTQDLVCVFISYRESRLAYTYCMFAARLPLYNCCCSTCAQICVDSIHA